MFNPSFRRTAALLALAAIAGSASLMTDKVNAAENFSPETKILKWPDGKQAVFLLQFDDSAPSAIKNAIPELVKRKMVGTFYINPGNGPYKGLQKEWESPAPGMVYANHTQTHVGATSVEQLDDELTKCNEVIFACYPNLKQPRLISFGQPGGVPWTVSPAEVKTLLDKHNLIERPPFKGYPFQFKTGDQILALVDAALAKGEMEYVVFHGVGGDWLSTPMEIYTALLDKLDASSGQIWITDPVSWHQYVTERKTAEVKVLAAEKNLLKLQLTSAADPVLYNLPLTLETSVPPEWKECRVKQGDTSLTVAANNGKIQYSAIPGDQPVLIEPVSRK
jgi:hypothetical protein